MPLPEGQLCSIEDVRQEAAPVLEWLASVGQTMPDTTLTQYIQQASRELQREVDRQLLPERRTEWYDGNDQTTLIVRRFPILKVHACRIWGGRHFLIWEFPPDKIIYEGEYTVDQYRQAELLVRREIGALNITLGLLEWFMPLRMQPPLFVWNRRFLKGFQNIEVDYTAGYGVPDPSNPDRFLPEPPFDVRRAATLKTCIKLIDHASGWTLGVTSRSLGDRTENFGGIGLFGTLRQRWLNELYGDGRTQSGIINRLKVTIVR